MNDSQKPQILETDLIAIEKKLNHLWGELNTINLSNKNRMNIENQLATIEIDFKKMMDKNTIDQNFTNELDQIDLLLAYAALTQAEQEISKSASRQNTFHTLENVKKELDMHKISPSKARHAIKEIVRHLYW